MSEKVSLSAASDGGSAASVGVEGQPCCPSEGSSSKRGRGEVDIMGITRGPEIYTM